MSRLINSPAPAGLPEQTSPWKHNPGGGQFPGGQDDEQAGLEYHHPPTEVYKRQASVWDYSECMVSQVPLIGKSNISVIFQNQS